MNNYDRMTEWARQVRDKQDPYMYERIHDEFSSIMVPYREDLKDGWTNENDRYVYHLKNGKIHRTDGPSYVSKTAYTYTLYGEEVCDWENDIPSWISIYQRFCNVIEFNNRLSNKLHYGKPSLIEFNNDGEVVYARYCVSKGILISADEYTAYADNVGIDLLSMDAADEAILKMKWG